MADAGASDIGVAAWLTIPADAEPDVSGQPPGAVARQYRVTEDLVKIRAGALEPCRTGTR